MGVLAAARRPASAALLALALGCGGPQRIAAPVELVRQVERYLAADDADASELGAELARRSVDQLAPALQAALDRPHAPGAPTGMLPDRPIRVEALEHRYSLYVPEDYDPGRRYPLVICLHGAGFGGAAYLDRWAPRLGKSYLLACPTIDGGAWWNRSGEALVLAVLENVARTYRVDADRVFLSGMSNGGIGAYLIGLNHVDRFAALVPMAAALPPPLFPLLDNAVATPLYLIHGARDQVMPIRYSRDVADYLRRRNQGIVYREHDQTHPQAGGHFFPKDELPALIDWLAQQRRAASPMRVVVVRDRDHTGRAYWTRIDAVSDAVGSFWASAFDRAESQRLQAGGFARLEAERTGNTITVKAENVHRFSLLFGPDQIDFDRSVRVVVNGHERFNGRVAPDAGVLLAEARRRPDPNQLIAAVVSIVLP